MLGGFGACTGVGNCKDRGLAELLATGNGGWEWVYKGDWQWVGGMQVSLEGVACTLGWADYEMSRSQLRY